jgi:hypothetical protein
MTDQQRLVAEELAGLLLSMPTLAMAAHLMSRIGSLHLSRIVSVVLAAAGDSEAGLAGAAMMCARLLEAIAPISAIYVVCDLWDLPQPLLPYKTRKLLFASLSPLVQRQFDIVQREVNTLAMQRSRHVRYAVVQFAAQHCLDAQQTTRVLKAARWEQDRIVVFTTLWGACVDEPSHLIDTWRALTFNEQRQVRHCFLVLKQISHAIPPSIPPSIYTYIAVY